MNEKLEKYWVPEGDFNQDQKKFLIEFLSEIDPKNILEIRSELGRSTCTILTHTSPDKFLSIDPVGNIEELQKDFSCLQTEKELIFKENWILSEFPEGIDLIYINGINDFDIIYNEISFIFPYLNEDCPLIINGFKSGQNGFDTLFKLDKAVEEFADKNGTVIQYWNDKCKGFGIIMNNKIPVSWGKGWNNLEFWDKYVRWSGHISDFVVNNSKEDIYLRIKLFNNTNQKNTTISIKKKNKFYLFNKYVVTKSNTIDVPLKDVEVIRITTDYSQNPKDTRLLGVAVVGIELLDKNKNVYKNIPLEYIATKKEDSVSIQNAVVETSTENLVNRNRRLLSKQKNFDKHIGSICLVNHCSNPYGATHYLLSLFKILKEEKLKVCILDERENHSLYEKYKIDKGDVISYEKDLLFLSYLYHYLKPSVFYLNSINYIFTDFIKLTKPANNMLIHSHEISKHFHAHGICPSYVVSKRIQQAFVENNMISQNCFSEGEIKCFPKVQSPILTKEILTVIDEELSKPNPKIYNKNGEMDYSKITIGMCGQTEDRKNPELFSEVASKFRDKNFLWIGGAKGDFADQPNLYHVPCVSLPFSYYNLIDYFVLFSKEDPCPYVVLENLYANNIVITFKENIYTDHKCELLKDLYFEFDGEVSLQSVSTMLEKYATKKNTRQLKNGSKYITNKFTSIDRDLINFLKQSQKK